MGVRFPGGGQNWSVNVTLNTTTEGVIVVTPPISPSLDSAAIFIFWWFALNSGASVTACTPRVRRGNGIVGALVSQTNAIPCAAGALSLYSGCFVDFPGIIAGLQYSLTGQQVAATGNGTVQDGCIIAMCL